MKEAIDWSTFNYSWTRDWPTWSNSSTLKININNTMVSLLEIQFHTTRNNMAIRWCYENFLTVFNDKLSIVSI